MYCYQSNSTNVTNQSQIESLHFTLNIFTNYQNMHKNGGSRAALDQLPKVAMAQVAYVH